MRGEAIQRRCEVVKLHADLFPRFPVDDFFDVLGAIHILDVYSGTEHGAGLLFILGVGNARENAIALKFAPTRNRSDFSTNFCRRSWDDFFAFKSDGAYGKNSSIHKVIYTAHSPTVAQLRAR